jgi:hypothetical protein
MGVGMHGENGIDPETTISLLRTYVLPILSNFSIVTLEVDFLNMYMDP